MLFNFLCGLSANLGFVPIFGGHVVPQIKFGGSVLVGAVVNLGIDQRQRNLGHTGGLAVTRAGKDDVFHAGTAQRLGRLLAEHPGNGVGNIGLAAAIRADNRRHTVAMELEFSAIAKRLESEDLELL